MLWNRLSYKSTSISEHGHDGRANMMPRKVVDSLVLTRLTRTIKGFQVPHDGMASRDILDRELIANGGNNNIRNPVLNRKLNNDEQGDLTYDDRVTRAGAR